MFFRREHLSSLDSFPDFFHANDGKGIYCYPCPSVSIRDGGSNLHLSFSGEGICVLWPHF